MRQRTIKWLEEKRFNKEFSKSLNTDSMMMDIPWDDVPCECDNEKSEFFQDHGCCQYCFYL